MDRNVALERAIGRAFDRLVVRQPRVVEQRIEATGLPVSFHIGENPPQTPNEFNSLPVGMMQSVSPFRDVFGKLIFGGILDRHPSLKIGFFEAGINWVRSALVQGFKALLPRRG